MAPSKIITLITFIAIVTIGSVSFIPEKAGRPVLANHPGFAVVELFTSEGCSSCPPADALVAKVQKESAAQPVYILAFHVDYWNRLGWKDQFSSHAYSERQYQYSNWLKLNGVYTPQAVVNGRTEFVGSEEGNLRNAIRSNLQKPAAGDLHLGEIKLNGRQAEVSYHAEGVTGATSLVLAVVQKAATSEVKSGENGGRTLNHVQIVRNLQTVSLSGKTSGVAEVNVPAGLNAQGLEIIAFLQDSSNGSIMAAAKAALPVATVITQANANAQ